MYLLVARYYIVRALLTPLGKKMLKKWGYMQKQQSKTNTMQMQVIDIQTYIYKLICELGFGRSNLL